MIAKSIRNSLSALASLALLSCFLFACEAQKEPPDINALKEFATRYAAAWSGQDPVAFASFYAEDSSLRINDGEPSIGRAAIEQTAREFMTAFPDMLVSMVEVRREGDHVEFHWHWTGTHTGPGGTGSTVDLVGFEQWTMDDDGLILESRGHMDDAEYQRQLAVGPKPCSEPWLEIVEQKLSTGDGQGHGPDLGSSEWRSVVEFKLGIRGNPEVPDRTTDEWCAYIDDKISQTTQ
jgi:steroid delta-isomerase-like uncharacterized protein